MRRAQHDEKLTSMMPAALARRVGKQQPARRAAAAPESEPAAKRARAEDDALGLVTQRPTLVKADVQDGADATYLDFLDEVRELGAFDGSA